MDTSSVSALSALYQSWISENFHLNWTDKGGKRPTNYIVFVFWWWVGFPRCEIHQSQVGPKERSRVDKRPESRMYLPHYVFPVPKCQLALFMGQEVGNVVWAQANMQVKGHPGFPNKVRYLRGKMRPHKCREILNQRMVWWHLRGSVGMR